MTAVTINLEKQPNLGLYIEREAQSMGVTPEVFIVSLISNSFDRQNKSSHELPAKLKELRGSLSPLKTMDLSSDSKAQMIMDK